MIHPRRPKAYLSHIRSRVEINDGSGSIFPQLTICDLVPPDRGKRRKSMGLDTYNEVYVVTNPWEAAISPDGRRFYTIYAGTDHTSVGVPKQALIYEGERVRLWVAHDDKSLELREIETGLTNSNLVEVRTNLKAGEKVVTKGSLFIDRAASGT